MRRSVLATMMALVLIGVGYQSSSFTFAFSNVTNVLELAHAGDGSKNILYGGCDTDPYEALKPYIGGGQVIPKQGSTGQLADGIDPALACRLTKFLAAAQSVCKVKIISGYRSPEQQQSMCGSGRTGCAAAGRSCHQYGLAIDLSSDCNGKLRELSKQYALHFPYSGNHVQCEEHRFANRLSCRGPCKGGVAVGSSGGGVTTPTNSAPTDWGSQLRQSLGLQQTQQAQQCALQGGSWLNNQCYPNTNQAPTTPTSPAAQQPTTASTNPTSGGSSGSGTTQTTTADPVLACAQEASDPVCAKQTTCPSVTSPSGACTVGAKKTYLNTCLMNLDKAVLVAQGTCSASAQDELTVLADSTATKKDEKPKTTVTLVPDTTENLDTLQDQKTNAFTSAPQPGTPSYDEHQVKPGGPVAQQTFSDPSVAVIPGSYVQGQQTNTTFVSTALNSIVTALQSLQEMLTPMRYTMNASGATEHNEAGNNPDANIYEDNIPIEQYD